MFDSIWTKIILDKTLLRKYLLDKKKRMLVDAIENKRMYILWILFILHYIDKQTTGAQESDTREFSFSGNVSYGKINMKGNSLKYVEGGKDDTYDYI